MTNQCGGGDVLTITQQEDLIFGVGTIETGNDRIDQVFDVEEAALVVDRAERQREVGIDKFEQALHVARIAWTID